MKKSISILISLVLIRGVLGGMTVSATGTVNLKTSTVSANLGDTVSVTVSVTSNSVFSF